MKEVWKTLKEHNNYEVSNYGKIRNKITGRILKTTFNNKGYERFIIYINRKPKCYYVHRIVAETFLTNENNYKEINHKDENKLNNYVGNLEYCDTKYNCNYGNRNRNIVKSKRHLFKTIIQKDMNDNIIRVWQDIIEIQEKTNYKKHNIYKCCQGKYEKAYGYKWEYVTNKHF